MFSYTDGNANTEQTESRTELLMEREYQSLNQLQWHRLKQDSSFMSLLRKSTYIVNDMYEYDKPFEFEVTFANLFLDAETVTQAVALQAIYPQLDFDISHEGSLDHEKGRDQGGTGLPRGCLLVKRYGRRTKGSTHQASYPNVNAQGTGRYHRSHVSEKGRTGQEVSGLRDSLHGQCCTRRSHSEDQEACVLDLRAEGERYLRYWSSPGPDVSYDTNAVLRVLRLGKDDSERIWGFMSLGTGTFCPLSEPRLVARATNTTGVDFQSEKGRPSDQTRSGRTQGSDERDQRKGKISKQERIELQQLNGGRQQCTDGNRSNAEEHHATTGEPRNEGLESIGRELVSSKRIYQLNAATKESILRECRRNDVNFDYAWKVLTNGDRYDFVEFCCSPNSRLTEECIRRGGKAYRINLANGYDLSTRNGVDKAIHWVRQNKPREAWISLPCGPWSVMQNMNQRTLEQIQRLNKKRSHSKRMIKLMVEIIQVLIEIGCKPVYEWPLRCSGWTLTEVQPILKALPYKSRVDGCQYDMRTVDTDELILKSWRIQCATLEQSCRITKTCSRDHNHAPIEGGDRVNATSYYPQRMVKKWVTEMMKQPFLQERREQLLSLQDYEHEIFGIPQVLSEGKDKSLLDKIDAMIQKIHRNSAHCNVRTLARVLKEDNAPEWVIQRALQHKCEECERLKQPGYKPPVSLNYETRLWHCVGIDNAELEIHGRIITFMLLEDEACGFCVPKVLFEREVHTHRNPTAQEVTDSFAEAWLSHYPKPIRVKTDPEGAFQSGEFRDFLAMNDIRYDPTAGDAHFQLGRVERLIQTIKRMSQKLAIEFPDANGIQILAAACSAHNELRRIKGYSPNQWVFGHAKPGWENIPNRPSENYERIMELRISAQTQFLKHQAHERIQTALRAKTRKYQVFEPGQTVMLWRTGKGTRTKPGKDGRWLGPAIVLIHQRSSNGSYGKIVWVSLGGKLYRVAPEHLRTTTEREGIIFETNYPRVSERFEDVLKKGEFEDLTGQANPTNEDYDMGDRILDGIPEETEMSDGPVIPPRYRRRIDWDEKARQDPQDLTNSTSSSSSKKVKKAIELVYTVEPSEITELVESPQKFFSQRNQRSNIKPRKAVEVNLKNLTLEELDEMEEAMTKELAEWLQEEALQTLTPQELRHIDPNRTLKMRWVLTYKPDPTNPKGKKAKARIVILGYQHPEVEELETASPTLGRTGKHLVLQWAAINKAIVESADAKSAFLQGDGQELDEKEPIYVRAIAEVAYALNVPIGTAVRIVKAVYGLGNAPRSWFYSVHRALTNINGLQLTSEPCIWKFTDTNGITIGLVAAYVDDFLIAGNHQNQEFLSLRDKIKNLYRWGNWERGTFTMCGVKITQKLDYSFVLDQNKYVHEGLTLIDIPKEADRPVNERELSQLRAVLGALQWKATQTGPHISSSLNALQSQVTKATLKTLKEANDLIKVTKLHDNQITIHHHNYAAWNELCSINWCDAAQGDRPDGGSTGGQVHGLAILQEITKGDWTPISLIGWNTSKLPRVARSSLAAEIQSMCIGEDESYLIRLMWGEINTTNGGQVDDIVNKVPCILVTDAKALYDASLSETSALGLKERRSGIELLALKENLQRNQITLKWVNSGAMLADPMTKGKMRHMMERFLKDPQWKIVEDPAFESFKKRVLKGQDALDYIYALMCR